MADIICSVLKDALEQGKGCLVGRNGNVEADALLQYEKGGIPWNSVSKYYIERTGWFCSKDTTTSLNEWANTLTKAIEQTDVIVSPWFAPLIPYEEAFLQRHVPSAKRIQLHELQPYLSPPDTRWTRFLSGQRVGIINAFANTALRQTKIATRVWPNPGDADTLLPEATYIAIPTYFSPGITDDRAVWPEHVGDWKAAVDYLENQCVDANIRIAIIGCGSLGMILGARLKQRGICCIVMGGATQCLFGIKGKRWLDNTTIRSFWNSAWRPPSRQETPDGYLTIEKGCYWMEDDSCDTSDGNI